MNYMKAFSWLNLEKNKILKIYEQGEEKIWSWLKLEKIHII